MLKRTQLTTAKGSLTNACIITQGNREMLFSYQTLAGIRKDGVCYFQREGLAGSRTTAKHISQWAQGRTRKETTEAELNAMAEGGE